MSDCDSLLKLSVQLGYNPSIKTVLAGLDAMKSNLDYEVVVITDDNVVVGWMSLFVRRRIEDVSFLQVAAIVTDESRRGSGFGKKLMGFAEQRASEKELLFVGLHSSKSRNDAHPFYERSGYVKSKESYFFRKDSV